MNRALIAKLSISITAVIVLIVHTLRPSLLPRDTITLGLLIIAILPWLYTVIEEGEVLGWKVKFRALEAKTDQLQQEIERTRNRIDNLVISSMSPRTLGNLKKLVSGNFGVYYLGTGLSRELSYLENIGYITFKCKGIDDIPHNGHEHGLNLSDFVEVTAFGIEYLELRQFIEQRSFAAKV